MKSKRTVKRQLKVNIKQKKRKKSNNSRLIVSFNATPTTKGIIKQNNM